MLKQAFEAARALTREAFRTFSARGARLLSGSIAFYALVSVVPMLVIALELASVFVDSGQARTRVAAELARWVGVGGAETIVALVRAAEHREHSGLGNVFGTLVLVYAATRLFSQLTTALDLLWETPPPPEAQRFRERAWRQFERRALAFVMVLLVGFLLTVTVLFHGALATARHSEGFSVPVSRLIEAPISLALTALLFAAVFRLLPRATVKLGDALVGGAVTAVLFTAGSLLITAYVTRRDTSVYGAAANIVVLMLWMHYSAQAFFLGAAFTRAHAERRELLAKAEK
ncbi:MAG: YihY/virulence factor BrkB family protein [Myxococcales bacterium]|nr:YihY/virulence factor BrkB family protein [Myxococcales bacterium]